MTKDAVVGGGTFALETAVDALNKIRVFMATYLKKALQPLQAAVTWLGKRMQAKIQEAVEVDFRTTIETFIRGLAINPTFNTWAVGVCGEGYLGKPWVSGCIVIPFTFGGEFMPENIVFEYAFGTVKQLRGAEPKATDSGLGAGVRFQLIVRASEFS